MMLRLFGSHHWSQSVIYLQIARIGHIQPANQQLMGRGGAFAPKAFDGMVQSKVVHKVRILYHVHVANLNYFITNKDLVNVAPAEIFYFLPLLTVIMVAFVI